jgi:transcriptional regulator with XRE-family HTH domain
MSLLECFGDRVRSLREARGWSQERLAAQSGLHRTYVGSVERGERNISLMNIARLAAALEVSVAHLVSEGAEASPGQGRVPAKRQAAHRPLLRTRTAGRTKRASTHEAP